MPEEKVGKVTHFFGKPMVAAIMLEAPVAKGDSLHVKGSSTDVTFEVASMQIEHETVDTAGPGDEVGVKVPEKLRPGDEVFKVVD